MTRPARRAPNSPIASCLLSGVTSLVDISPAWDGWIELFAKSGMRGFLAPGYASARWRLDNDFELKFAWDEARGREGFATALALIDRAAQHPSGRLSGVVSPMQIENCTADLLRDSRDAARERGIPFTVHIAQSVTRGAGDDPAPRQDAGPMGARDRHSRPRHDPRPRAVSRHAFLDPLVDADRSAR